jgi:hypothetical protein
MSLEEVLESDWTLAAVKRREEERLEGERAHSPADAEAAPARPARDLSGNNWIAEAFRRRQEEERKKAAIPLLRGGGRADAAEREVPVDNWLIEGFKRHQEEERRREAVPQSDEAVVTIVSDGGSTFELEPSGSQDSVALEQVGLSQDSASQLLATGGDDEAPVGGAGPLAVPVGAAIDRRQGRAARWTTIAALLAVGGVISYIGLKAALWSSFESSRGFDRGDAPGAPPPAKLEDRQPPLGAPPGVETSTAPTPEPEKQETAPTDGPAAQSTDAAPPAVSDALTVPPPAPQAPEKSEPNPTAPRIEEGNKAQAPSAEPSDKAVQENGAAPTALPPAVAPRPAAGAAPPEKKPDAEPAAVAPEGAREQIKPEHEPNASEVKRRVDAKPKQQAKERNTGRHASRKADGLTTFLKRTATSVRKFFGRLGEKQ